MRTNQSVGWLCFLPSPLAGRESFHICSHSGINQCNLVSTTGIAHGIEEREDSMSSLKELHQVLMAVVRDLNGFDSRDLVLQRVLNSGLVSR